MGNGVFLKAEKSRDFAYLPKQQRNYAYYTNYTYYTFYTER